MLALQKILVWSNDTNSRRNITECFEGLDAYDLSQASSEDDLFSRLADNAIDLLIIDMNETSAVTSLFLTKLKKKCRNQKTAVVISDKNQLLEVLLRGAADVIIKPFNAITVTQHVNVLLRDKRACRRFELGDNEIHIVILNQDGVRLKGLVDNICLDGVRINVTDTHKANTFFNRDKAVDILFQPANNKPLIKIFRGSVARIINERKDSMGIAVYLTPERNINFLDDFVTYFNIDLEKM